jgi:hypothetical protein
MFMINMGLCIYGKPTVSSKKTSQKKKNRKSVSMFLYPFVDYSAAILVPLLAICCFEANYVNM